jgi:hypothetical protein
MHYSNIASSIWTKIRSHPKISLSALFAVALFTYASVNPPNNESSVQTTATSTTLSNIFGSPTELSYQECLPAWLETDNFSSISGHFDCFSIQYFCDNYRTLQSSLDEVDRDTALGYAIPSDATVALTHFGEYYSSIESPRAKSDEFALVRREITGLYRALRVAYLKEQIDRIDSVSKQIEPLKIRMDSMCEPVPSRDE